MIFRKTAILYGTACMLAVVAGASRADWAESTDISVVRPAPSDLLPQPQNPPAFTWARFATKIPPTQYKLEISQGGKVVATYFTKRSFYLPSTRMAEGTYTWRVLPDNSTVWSTPRTFIIDKTSVPFEVPENAALKATILARARPRQMGPNFLPYAQWPAAMKTARGPVLTSLQNTVKSQVALLTPVNDAMFPVTSLTPSATRTQYINDMNKAVSNNGLQLESAALLYRLTADPLYLNIALARGDELAALDPNGMSSYINNDQCTRTIMLTLAKAVDFLGTSLDATRKARWLASISARVAPMYADLSSGNFRLDDQPFDSHGTVAQGYLAVISILTLGDIPEAQDWFEFSFRAYINSIYVWSGAEGGYSNGTAYGMYSTDYALQLWQTIANATNVDLFKKPWAAGFSRYLMHFLPPGAPGHVFGDQHEYGIYMNYLKGFVSRIATPNAAWYVKNLTGANERDLTILEGVYPLPVDTVVALPVPPANAAVYPSIGWVAMHSNLADRARTSVYFKSSWYGSYNHSHADQNSLVIDSGGRRLLIEAGYQDYPILSANWYRETRAHNGITFNGGVGQSTAGNVENLARKGKILQFTTTPDLDFAKGDATVAYGGAVTSAIRQVWYSRLQDVVIVQDKLAAPTALTFEWNLHTAAPIVIESPTSIKVTNVDRSFCATSVSADPSRFEKTAGLPNPMHYEDQGRFIKTAAATTAEFVVVLDIGCKRPAIKFSGTGASRTLTVGTQTIPMPQ